MYVICVCDDPLPNHRLEDGTVSFHSIIAVKYGLSTLTQIGGSMDCISKYTFNIARYDDRNMIYGKGRHCGNS